MTKPRILAFYLPQYHPTPENDEWWGKGFTEWTNVGKAKKYFIGHKQPVVPTDLGYYDLRVSDTQKEQVKYAKASGIEGFCYWHYWFGNGKLLLEKPAENMLADKSIDFPFCFGWANETWKGFAHGLKNRNVLIEQKYEGNEDYVAHFNYMLKFFLDERYIRCNNKPVFLIYNPQSIPNINEFMNIWNSLARENGLSGIFFIGQRQLAYTIKEIQNLGVDGVYTNGFLNNNYTKNILLRGGRKLLSSLFRVPVLFDYYKVAKGMFSKETKKENVYPGLLCGWDHTPRSGRQGSVLIRFSLKMWEKHINDVLQNVAEKKYENNFVFLKSWNEWAEGNFMEPDLRYGTGKMDVLSECLGKYNG